MYGFGLMVSIVMSHESFLKGKFYVPTCPIFAGLVTFYDAMPDFKRKFINYTIGLWYIRGHDRIIAYNSANIR